MEITINGEMMTLSEDVTTIKQLINYMKIESPVIIVEQNGTILDQEAHTAAEVKQGDSIELVQFVGGG
ncbi:MAG TPA: sulfur carrier protein ThiS [Virgibacillus sp.]|nr:sulfur carrier protein ThiS [Virgibacillus sp.]